MDLGCGVGAVFLSLLCRQPAIEITAVEKDSSFIALAEKNVEINGHKPISLIHSDIRELDGHLEPNSFDLVLANPPFYPAGSGRLSPDAKKAVANHEIFGSLKDWISTANLLCKEGGTFSLIHLADRQEECLAFLQQFFGITEMAEIRPKTNQQANRVLFRCQKGGTFALEKLDDVVVHEADGKLTQAASKAILGTGWLKGKQSGKLEPGS